jgi:SPP1 gp7 family putative phage head morphogenesis protein
MANTFPRHLENQLVNLYSSYVKRLAAAIAPPLVRKFEKENPELVEADGVAAKPNRTTRLKKIEGDALMDDLAALPEKVEERDPATIGALVTIGAIIIPKFMFDGIENILTGVDEWSFMKMRQEAIAFERFRKAPGLAQLIEESNLATQEALLKSVKLNAGLIKDIRRTETQAIAEEIKQAVLKGRSLKVLKKRLIKTVGATDSKAAFWARDQVSKVSMDLNFARLDSAGFPAYKWNTSRDARVRPDHIWREGRVFQRGTGLQPGEDPNCRCTPGPAFGQSDESSPTERRRTLTAINKDRRTVNALKKNKNKKPLEVLGKEALEKPAEAA